MHSPFEGMTAEETFNSHQTTLRGLRIRGIIATVALGALGIWGIERGWMWLYVAGLAGILVTVFLFLRRMAREVEQLQGILWQDADVATYRAVLEMGLARTRRRQTRAALELELAFCDYFDGLDGAALERIQGLTFRGCKNTQRLRCLDLEALLFDARGDVARRDEALGRIREMAAQYRPGTKVATAARDIVRSLELGFTPPAQWTEGDARFFREQMVLADKRVNRAGARLRLDVYEAAHGRTEEALRDLRALGEERLVPRYETMRVQLLHRIERQASAAQAIFPSKSPAKRTEEI